VARRDSDSDVDVDVDVDVGDKRIRMKVEVEVDVEEERWALVDKAYQVDSIDRALNVIVRYSESRMH
jgi:hypothetical protein